MSVLPNQYNPSTFLNGVYPQPQVINNQIPGQSALPQINSSQNQNWNFPQNPSPYNYTLGGDNMNAVASRYPSGNQQVQSPFSDIMNAIRGGSGNSSSVPQQSQSNNIFGLFGR